ncbi:MAG TPA: lysylphosphatidylglycerol synthase transmembrane domain-containing protein [Solirubrobacteraceae bacterium]
MAATLDGDPAGGKDSGMGVESPEVNLQESSRSLGRGLISLAILVAIVAGLLVAVPGLHGVAERVGNMNAGWLMLAVLLEILSCVGYVIVFLQVFDRAPIRFGARVALSELAFGAAVSLGGAGSVAVGAWLLVDRGGDPVRIAQRSVVLFLLTSAVNVVTLVLAGLGLFTGILPGPSNPLLSIVPAGVGTAVLVFFLLLPRVSERLAAHREPGRIHTLLLETAASIRQTEQLILHPDWRILGALGFLWFDIGVLAACFAAAGVVPPIGPLVLAYQIGYLSNVIPVPGGIGVLDGSLVGMLVLYGASATTGTAATVVYHAIALWIPAMWGTGAFIILRRTRGRPIILRPPRAERRAQAGAGRRRG